MTDPAPIGTIRINATDYDGDIVVELFDYSQSGPPHWHVPAWDERGMGSLCGPFQSAREALSAALDFYRGRVEIVQ